MFLLTSSEVERNESVPGVRRVRCGTLAGADPLVGPAHSHEVFAKMKPCMWHCKPRRSEAASGLLNQLGFRRWLTGTEYLWLTHITHTLVGLVFNTRGHVTKKKVSHYLGSFAKLGRTTIRFVMLVRAWDNSAPNGRIFIKFDIWGIFENLSRKFKFGGNLTKNNGYFTWKPMYKHDNILPNFSQNEKYFRQSCREKSENTFYVHFLSYKHGAVYEIMCKYMEHPVGSLTTI